MPCTLTPSHILRIRSPQSKSGDRDMIARYGDTPLRSIRGRNSMTAGCPSHGLLYSAPFSGARCLWASHSNCQATTEKTKKKIPSSLKFHLMSTLPKPCASCLACPVPTCHGVPILIVKQRWRRHGLGSNSCVPIMRPAPWHRARR